MLKEQQELHHKALKELKDLVGLKEHKVLKVEVELKVLKELHQVLDHKGLKVQRDLQILVTKGLKGQEDPQEVQDHRVLKEQQEVLAHQI